VLMVYTTHYMMEAIVYLWCDMSKHPMLPEFRIARSCVHVCARACVCACVCVRVRVCARACGRVCV
jgi:hypothetical protein